MRNESVTPGQRTSKCRPGPIMRNPYLNFCREFRKKYSGLTAVQIVQKAATAWKGLGEQEKIKYIVDAFYAKKRNKAKGHRSSARRIKHRSRSDRRFRR